MKNYRLRLHIIGILLLTGLFLSAFQPATAQSSTPLVLILENSGAITPAMNEYLLRGIQTAEQRGAEAIIYQLDTPGGSIELMNEMVQSIRASSIPVIVYIAPKGAMAGSAGTLITLAGHAAVMAPETIIGAASPVGEGGSELDPTIRSKMVESTKATARTLAERRGEEAVTLAEATIESAKAVSSSEALAVGLIDFIADDISDLLRQLDGFTVEMTDGPRTLDTANARTEELPMTFIEQLLDILVDPNIVFLLITIGVQSILIEISSPGGWVAGFIGAISLALAAYGLGVLPVNWFGVIFLLIAFVLFILDVKAPTHGALTAAGIGSLIVGALVLFNSPGTPQFQRVSIPLVVTVAGITGLLFFIIVGFAVRAQRRPIQSGQEALAGKFGVARTDIKPSGQVQAEGELWTAELAEGAEPIRSGEHVEIVEIKGLKLKVRKTN